MTHRPTDETRQHVKQLAISGATQEDICKVLAVALKTLRKHYREELDTAVLKANANVAGWLYQNCQAGNVSAQIFWLKTRAQWKEEMEHGASVNINIGSKDVSLL